MYSQCPECLTRFRVTAAALRAAHGTVRCGRCGSAFDALPRLSDALLEDAPSPAQPAALSFTAGGGAAADSASLRPIEKGSDVPEFHFSADDIEQVFIDARDWQNRFGSASASNQRADRLADAAAADLVEMLDDPDEDDDARAEREAADPPVWVHEPEAVEDITLEGERIQIEGLPDSEEDFLEREIENALEEQHLAETTGNNIELAEDEFALEVDPQDGAAINLDSTDQVEILREELEPVDPHDDMDSERADPAPEPEILEVAAETPAAIDDLEVSPLPADGRAAAIAAAQAPPEPVPAVRTVEEPRPPVVVPMSARWRRPTTLDQEHDHFDPDEELESAVHERRASWAWGLAALLAALVLASQVAHHFRESLARDANLGPPLREIYSRLGRPLPPNWNLGAFELRQWGANESEGTAAGRMTVRASLRNGAPFAQPIPLLRLEMEDRFGGTVARRDFQPAEYLKDPAQARRLLAPGAATEAELAIVDTAPDAVGYRLDVCMRDEAGAVICAQRATDSDQTSQ